MNLCTRARGSEHIESTRKVASIKIKSDSFLSRARLPTSPDYKRNHMLCWPHKKRGEGGGGGDLEIPPDTQRKLTLIPQFHMAKKKEGSGGKGGESTHTIPVVPPSPFPWDPEHMLLEWGWGGGGGGGKAVIVVGSCHNNIFFLIREIDMCAGKRSSVRVKLGCVGYPVFLKEFFHLILLGMTCYKKNPWEFLAFSRVFNRPLY